MRDWHQRPVVETDSAGQRGESKGSGESAARRFFALDSVRATAMLLGVFYHLPIAFMTGGFGGPMGFGASPKTSIDNWLHSFRMPLFFLISGFFASMMLGKYSLGRYLTRRWWRIGAPLFIALPVLAGVRITTEHFQRPTPPPAFGGLTAPGPGFGVAPGGFGMSNRPTAGDRGVRRDFGGAGVPGFGAPPAGFGPASPSRADGPKTDAGPPAPGSFPGFAPPPGTFGSPPPGGTFNGFGGGGFGGGQPGFPGMPPFGGGQNPPAVPWGGGPPGPDEPRSETPPPDGPRSPLAMREPPARSWAHQLFGNHARHLSLEHLWFLWYLLLFVTVGPVFALLGSRFVRRSVSERFDRFGRWLLRFNILAFVVGLITLPALIHARSTMGWSLTNPIGFSGAFPDFLFQYFEDQPFYLCYFLVGWWFFRLRTDLSEVGRFWLWNLALGIGAFAASQKLFDVYAMQTEIAYYAWIRLGSFLLYGLGTAFSAFGFIGFFQQFLDHPTRAGRYIADTSLWIYLVHLPLIPYLLWWFEPWRSAWWAGSLAGMVVVTGVTLVMFELLVRPTPLVHVFGPANARRRAGN